MLTPREIKARDRIAERYENKVLSAYLRKETAADKAFHYYVRDVWIRTCDMALILRHRLYKLVSNFGLAKHCPREQAGWPCKGSEACIKTHYRK